MATTRIHERLRSIRYQEKPRPALWGWTRPEHQPRLLHLLLVLAPLLVGCTVLVPVDGPVALLCGAAAGAVVIAWPWWRLYWAMRVAAVAVGLPPPARAQDLG